MTKSDNHTMFYKSNGAQNHNFEASYVYIGQYIALCTCIYEARTADTHVIIRNIINMVIL